jgi:DnaJ domain
MSTIKIKIPHDELCRRAAVCLDVGAENIVSVFPTEGGRTFFVVYRKPYDQVSWQGYDLGPKLSTTLTVWQILEALPLDDVVGGVETIWSKGIDTMLEVLGLTKMPASERELKSAYRKAAKAAHPDAGGTEEAFRLIRAAYQSLMMTLPNLSRS